MKALAVSRNALGQQDATGSFLIAVANAVVVPASLPVPLSTGLAALIALLVAVTVALRLRRPASSRLLTVLLTSIIVSTLAWAATVTRDGNVGDWLGVSPAVTDASGDAPANADILAVYQQQDANNLYIRIDADVRLDTPVNLAPVVNAGANQTITLPAAASLTGSASDDGLPNPPATLTYAWTKVSGPGTVTFAAATSAATTATFGSAGSYVLRLTASDSALTGSANVTITVNAATAVNQAPVVNAGPNQTIAFPAAASLTGSATDDGLPNPPATLTYAWSKVSGPGTVTFASATSAVTTATFSLAGSYVLRLTANDSALTGSADVTINAPAAPPVNVAPTVNAGANQTITLPANASLIGSATDDGLPNPPATLTYAWSKVSGPGIVTFGNAAAAVTSATFGAAGSYVLRLTASDSALSGSGDVTITVNAVTIGNQAPLVNAGAAQAITLPATASLNAVVTDDGLPNPPGAVTLSWSKVSGPGNVIFANPNAAATTATFAAAGNYVLRLTANDSALTGTATVAISVADGAPTLAAVADRTIQLGSRFQQVLVASDANINDTLSFTLPTAPSGATLAPAPLIDWTPTAAQLGTHTFTASVTDSAGHSASTTFHVTVVHTNLPPQLGAQLNVILPIGTAFNRTLTAIDPDVGDALGFMLVSGPTGMTLSGSALQWLTAGKAAGDYAVTVRVTDAGGLSDSKSFTITLQAAAPPPVAVDDTYSTRLGQTLTIPARGVLSNDTSPSGAALSAIKLTNPDKGTLTAFNANGSFTYQAPAALPGSVFTPVLRNHKDLSDIASNGNAVLIDLDGDGKPELVRFGLNHNIYAIHADTGEYLWRFSGSFFVGCTPYGGVGVLAAADIDDDGKPEVIFAGSCAGDNGSMRIVALNGQNGTVKWVSPPLAAIPVLGDGTDLTTFAVPTIARLRTGESPSVLINVQAQGAHRYAIVGPDAFFEPACRLIVDTVPDGDYQPNPAFPPHYQQCRGVIVLNGTDGTVRQRMIAKKTPVSGVDGGTEQTGLSAPVVVDLDGDGTPEIVAGGVVFNLNGTPRWQGASANIREVAVGNFDDTPDIEVVRFEEEPGRYYYLSVYKSDGSVLWRLQFDYTTFIGKIVVGDLDGDGKADIVFNYGGLLCAIKHDGTYRWCNYEVVGGVSLVDSRTRVAIFDFDGDGVAEVVLQTTQAILFLDGLSGKVKASFPISKASTGSIDPPPNSEGVTYHPNAPMVGDVDGDGRADLMFFWSRDGTARGDFGAPAGFTVLKGQNNDWRPARGVQNQFAYHVANINDNGTIPTVVPLPNNFAVPRTNVFGTQAQTLAPVDPRKATQTSFTYKVNDGTFDSAPATVKIDIAPVNRPPVFDSIPPTRYNRNFAPFSYAAHATDPDVGDTITYRIVFSANSDGCTTIDATTGVLSCARLNDQNAFFLIAATDSQGAEALQTIRMTGVTTSSTVPNVIGQLQAAAGTTLTTAGLAVGVVTTVVSGAPVGQVLAQAPSAGTVVLTGEAVALNVSSGPAPVIVPFVVGETLTLATTQLTALNLTVVVTPAFSTTIPVNQVMAQTPAAGTTIVPTPANPVTLTTSAGPPLSGTIAQIIVEPGTTTRLVGENLQYKATAIFTDNTSADVTLAATWQSTSPAAATVNPAGLARAVASGGTTLTATVGAVTGQTILNVVTRITGDAVLPVAIIAAPTAGSTITGPATVTGTATDANFLRYELAFAIAGDLNFTMIAEGTAPVSNGTLGTLDPTTLINDLYMVRLTVFDRGGNRTVATTTVQASGAKKVGLFSLTFQDLNIPVAGIPITVTRTYDSRDKGASDFGVGWRLGLNTLRLRVNRIPGTGWVRSIAGVVVTLMPTSEHKVSLTLGDGRVEEFDMVVSPASNIGSLNATTVTGYVARTGTLGKLQVLGNTSLLILNGGAEDELVDDITLNAYDPPLFRYTTIDGTLIEIDRTRGVQKVTDSNGNSVTFGPGGIIHSAGKSVTFTRDAQNRITQITDPLGNVQSYVYDTNGDLASHINAAGDASRYKYDRSHNLIDLQDPTGNRPARIDYDAAGRMLTITDANGNQITYTHNPAANEELITDRLGRTTRMVYDGLGNVTLQEQAVTINGALVNAASTATYDTMGNETSRVNPDGLRTSATYSGVAPLTTVIDSAGLNLTQSYAYNARNDVTNAADAGGRTYNFLYDGNGNTVGVTTPEAGAVSSMVDAKGSPVRTVDALGTVTLLTRDAVGQISREEIFDAGTALLRRVDFTYDGNGNKVTETLFRTTTGVTSPLVTRYTYDAANRLIAVTDPLGAVSRIEYDAVGKVVARIDALGRRTTYTYDTLSRLVRTTFPDTTFETSTYDAESNAVTTTDRANRTTTYAYDELKRRVSVTQPDGSTSRTVYSAGGRVTAMIDALGNRTDFTYDSAGRHTATTLPAVVNGIAGSLVRPQVVNSLNALGVPLNTLDPLGRNTTYQYDASGRLTGIRFPDGSSVAQSFDVLGRRVNIANEEGQTTTFGYDGLGRLNAVAGLAGQIAYAYDEAGNMVTQTDALGRITRFRHDAVNRLVERQYPGGATERFAYDAVGNLIVRTDGLGRTASIAFDAMNRPTIKSFPGAATITTSYTPDGQRAAVTDPRGVTTYGYDALGRLASVVHPGGATVVYSRDANGNLLTLAAPAGSVNYAYDALNRLAQVNAPEGTSQSFYDLAGNRVRHAAANGVRTDASFDLRNRPSQLTHLTTGGTVLQSFASIYSPAGRRTRTTESDGSVDTYAYDAKGRLATETRTGTSPLSITHAYDAVGNRMQTVRGGVVTSYSYDVDDHLLTDGTATYAWDANGNLASKTAGAAVTAFGYNGQHRLVSILGAGLTDQYIYDADGNRVEASTAAGLIRFLGDAENNTGLSNVVEERDRAGVLQARYTYGAERLMMSRGGTASFPLADGFGSTRALADGAQAITDRYQYDAYGSLNSASGATVNPYRYRSERFDEDSGLYQLRARYYNPALGVFTSRDPVSGVPQAPASRHRTLYANADPVNNADPTGEFTLPEISLISALQNGLDAAFKVGAVVNKGCTLFQQLNTAGTMILLGGLASSAISASLLYGKLPGKVAYSLFGYNPIPATPWALKSVEFRLETPFAAKLSTTLKSGVVPVDITLSPKELVLASGANAEFHEFTKCGLKVGSASVKGRLKGGLAAGSFGVSISTELQIIGLFRIEYPLLEETISAKAFKIGIGGLLLN